MTGFVWLWEAFNALSSCRAIGMSVGPIPWTAIQQYADVHGFTEDETYMLHNVVRHADDIFLKHVREKN